MEASKEHPEADEIRRQVEHYFSDENLPTDMFLKKNMLESGDGTILLKEILRFPKMRHFRPKTAVIAALKQSPFLKISDDNKYISRRVPFIWADDHIDAGYEQREAEWQARSRRNQKPKQAPKAVGMAPKLAAGMDKPTGFEDTFVDGPITPAEYEEERQTYDPDESITERLFIAIHRFTSRRKFHQSYALIFTAFLKYGGVEGRGGEFQGGSVNDEDLEDMTPGQIAYMKCSFDLGDDKDPADGIWELDFEGVAKGFLSSKLPDIVPASAYPLALRILKNFYNYLLVHDVFHPQKEAHIVASIQSCISLCNRAASELPNLHLVGRTMPGDFNVAASALSGGYYGQGWLADQSWTEGVQERQYNDEFWNNVPDTNFSPLKARIVLSVGIAAHGSEGLFDALESSKGNLVCLEEKKEVGLEVLDIMLADEKVRELYENDENAGKGANLKKLGKLVCQEWEVPSFSTWDLPPAAPDRGAEPQQYEFWVEDDILQAMCVGTKLVASLRRLAFGAGPDAPCFWTFAESCRAYCSFYTYLPNELMTREPKPVRWLREGEQDEGDKDAPQDDDDL